LSDQEKPENPPAAKRGEAAWKEARDRIAERNDATRKAGKKQREEYERGQQESRRAADARRRAALLKRSNQD